MKPTAEQVQTEIEKLKALKEQVPAFTHFGDDNTEAIRVQIEVLQGERDEDAIYEEFHDNDHLRHNALYALEWLETGVIEDAEEGDTPASMWEPLVK